MKINLIGHASIFVETENCRILMDPVLWDPFCEGYNESCPKREVIAEKLPEFDFLVISHKHLDHFDLRSLAYLPKKVDVLIPRDKLIFDCLRQLGYSRIYPLKDFTKIKVGDTTMLTTRSEIPVPEYGMIFADSSGVFWNAVDTLFSPATIQTVKTHYPTIDFILTPWHISLEGKYQYNHNVGFPYHLYGYLFNLLDIIQAKAIAPGAQAFKYIKEAAWQNQIVFPVTRERFCHDLKTVFPEIQDNIFTLNPGDTLVLDSGKYRYFPTACDYVKTIVDDRELVDYTPVTLDGELKDTNPENYNLEHLYQKVEEEISKLPQFILEQKNSLFQEHIRWQVIHQIEVVFPDTTKKWYIDFSSSEINTGIGRNPLANLFTYITASSLVSLIEKKRDWDYLICNGSYRTFQKVYSLSKFGIVTTEASPIKDTLELRFPTEYVAGGNVYQELEEIKQHLPPEEIEEDENPMIVIGNFMVKRQQKNPVNS